MNPDPASASGPSDPDADAPDADAPDAPLPTSVVPVDLRDYVRFSPDAAQRIRVLATDALAVDLWCIEPGQSTPVLRLKTQDAAYTVLGGRSWFVTDEGEVGLDPMGAMLVPAGVVHGVDNRGVDPLVIVASLTPPGAGDPVAPVATDATAVRIERDEPGLIVRVWHGLMGAGRDRDA